uniref:Aminotransferase-like plant mobile domain-containing protein n=1 Tax=Setaria italica TaxID=4555 RepID=K3XTE6_SETIT
MVIEEGRVFKDLPVLKRWLQAFAVIRKRPYKVLHSYAERRYTVVCDKERCPWRVCAKKQNITGKWKITKVVDPHNCADHELIVRHPQLTSTLIAKRTVEEIYGGYVITYGKAWRAKQRAWKMIYGDWESGYEQLPVLFNAIKTVNPGMHYEYIPKPNAWKDRRQIFGRAFWCFPQSVEAFRHCRPLIPLAFALVERENNDSWGWFLRLGRIHMVGPGREVGVISDRHQTHRGRLIAEGQVRRVMPKFNSAAITALVDRWWPETHSFHLPFGEMTVTLQDCQKMLALSIRGHAVTGPCVSEGWRARMAAFLGQEVEEQGSRTSGVLISWLREHFGQCPQDAYAGTVGHYCRVWILHLFACVLFPDATGDTASWMWIHCLTDWHQARLYSWGSAVLCFLHRQLCEAYRRTSGSALVGGCVYLLQLWMWARLPVGRPEIMPRRPWFPGEMPRWQPTWVYIWDQVKVSHTRLDRAYLDYINEIDALTAHSSSASPDQGARIGSARPPSAKFPPRPTATPGSGAPDPSPRSSASSDPKRRGRAHWGPRGRHPPRIRSRRTRQTKSCGSPRRPRHKCAAGLTEGRATTPLTQPGA